MAAELGTGETERRYGLAKPFDSLILNWLKIIAALAVGVIYGLRLKTGTTEAHFFWTQDLPVLGGCLALVLALGLAPQGLLARVRIGWPAQAWVAVLALVCFAAGAIGVRLVFPGYTLSLDEFLANFDAQIFARGELYAPIPPAWQPYAPTMQPMYMLPLPDNLWASAYLPVNAAIRALASKVGAIDLVNPAMSAFSIVATYAVGRRLWPEQPRIALIGAALLGTSAQLIVMSMTAYAMPAHLAFNMAWLWLFLRRDRIGHAGALIIGFFAGGLHQLSFHPLFVAPFILQLWLDRRITLASVYTLAYAAICVFWVEYWAIAKHFAHVAATADTSTGGGYFVARIWEQIQDIGFQNIGGMAENLMRFVTWQNPLTAPLALAGVLAAERAKGHLRAMVLGVLITLLLLLFLVPSQTHGWGYRYLHGFLGTIALVAAWSFTRLTASFSAQQQAAATGGLAAACAASLLVLVPLRASQAASYVRPYVAANAAIQSAPAEVVVIDHNSKVLFDMGTLTRNDPFFERGPKVMALAAMDEDTVRQLCADHPSLLIFNGQSAASYGIDVVKWEGDPDIAKLRALMAQLHCGHVMLHEQPAIFLAKRDQSS